MSEHWCNDPDPPLADIVFFGLSLSGITIHPPFRACVLAGTLSFLQSMWDHLQIPPPLVPSVLTGTSPRVYYLRGTARRLAHRGQRPCWHSSLPPIDVGPPPNPTPIWCPASLLAHRLVFTPLWRTARRLTHRGQRPRWHSFLPLIDVGPPPNPTPLWCPASLLTHHLVSTPFGEQQEGWHIVRCLALIPFVMTITIHPLRGQRPHWHSFLPPIDVGPPPNLTPPPLVPVSLLAHCLVSTPFGEQREGWHIVRCLVLIPLVMTQIHR